MGAVSAQKTKKPKKFSKRNKRKNILDQRKERARKQLVELKTLLLQTTDLELKRAYVKHMQALAQKVQLQLPTKVKYSFCRRCTEVFTLVPEQTFKVRLKTKPEKMIEYTCLRCGYRRKKLYKKKILPKEDKKEQKKP